MHTVERLVCFEMSNVSPLKDDIMWVLAIFGHQIALTIDCTRTIRFPN